MLYYLNAEAGDWEFLESKTLNTQEDADFVHFDWGVLQGVAGCCRVLQGVAGCCRVLQDVTGCCRVLKGSASCCRVLQDGALCRMVLCFKNASHARADFVVLWVCIYACTHPQGCLQLLADTHTHIYTPRPPPTHTNTHKHTPTQT